MTFNIRNADKPDKVCKIVTQVSHTLNQPSSILRTSAIPRCSGLSFFPVPDSLVPPSVCATHTFATFAGFSINNDYKSLELYKTVNLN